MKTTSAIAVLVCCAAAAAPCLGAEQLGRLFFTPAQRKMLESERYALAKAPAKPVPRTMRVDGLVTRSDSERTVWVNGTAYHDRSPEGVQIGTDPSMPASASIRVPGKPVSKKVKVGQQLELNSGQVREDLSKKRVEPAPVPPEPKAESNVPQKVENGAAGTDSTAPRPMAR